MRQLLDILNSFYRTKSMRQIKIILLLILIYVVSCSLALPLNLSVKLKATNQKIISCFNGFMILADSIVIKQ
jgi:hypothetical protein